MTGLTAFGPPYERQVEGSDKNKWHDCMECGRAEYMHAWPRFCPGCGRRVTSLSAYRREKAARGEGAATPKGSGK